ncbi:MAG: acylphosphatase [Rhodanobacter sp.]
MASARFTVRGRVQGVFFRASTREQALTLGLAGYATNCADGSVEVLAAGSVEALHALERCLDHGPPAARVDSVRRQDCPEHQLHGFRIG